MSTTSGEGGGGGWSIDGKLFPDVLMGSEGDRGLVMSPFTVTLSPALIELVLLERLLPMLNKFLFAFSVGGSG